MNNFSNDPYSQPGQFSSPPAQPTKRTFKQRFRAMPRWKRFGSVGCGCFTALILFLALCSIIGNALPKQPVAAQPSPTPIRHVASVKHATKPTAVSTPTPVPSPTSVPTQSSSAIVATHGRPYLGGPVSDFYGKYGQPVGDARPDSTGWFPDDSSDLVVHYNATTQNVNYISYSGPSDWSKEQYKTFLLTFAPDDATENTQANDWWKSQGGDPYDPIAYTSPTVGKFFLHISDGSGYANIV